MKYQAPHTCLQKPRPKKKIISPSEKRELCRKKLIERSKSKSFKVKALVHHIPTDKDINNLFKEFTVDFLLKGMYSKVPMFRKIIVLHMPIFGTVKYFIFSQLTLVEIEL